MAQVLKERAREYETEISTNLPTYVDWVFQNRFFPDGLLPASFQANGLGLNTSRLLDKADMWRMPLRISPPDNRMTSEYFGVYHPDALHDFFLELKKLDLKQLLKQSESITSYSFPLPNRLKDREDVRGISDYLRYETDVSSSAYDYSALIKLDIKHFYPSIYFHSIHWAIDGYENIRNEDASTLTVRLDKKYGVGHQLDQQIQAMHGGFTKGLTVGPAASDIVAEILMRHIDSIISAKFKKQKIDACGARYKDDYRIFVRNENNQNSVIRIVEDTLKKYLLYLNSQKTSVGRPFELLQREWMVEYHSVLSTEEESKSQKHFLWHLAYVADLQNKYPGKRLIAKFLTNSEHRPRNEEELYQVISVLLSLSDIFRGAVPYVVSYIEKVALDDGIERACEYIMEKLTRENNAYNAIWYLHFLANYLDDYEEKLPKECKEKFKDNPFWKSLLYQRDHVFSDTSLKGSYFTSTIGEKIYEQTEKYANEY